MEVEPDLADRGDPVPPGQSLERRAIAGRVEVLRLVRMNADGGQDSLMPLCQIDRLGGVFQGRSGNEKPRDAGRARALQHRRDASFRHLKMAMTIRKIDGLRD